MASRTCVVAKSQQSPTHKAAQKRDQLLLPHTSDFSLFARPALFIWVNVSNKFFYSFVLWSKISKIEKAETRMDVPSFSLYFALRATDWTCKNKMTNCKKKEMTFWSVFDGEDVNEFRLLKVIFFLLQHFILSGWKETYFMRKF